MNERAISERTELLHKKDEGYRSSSNWHFILYLAGLIIAVLAIRAFVFEPIKVDGTSMCKTLQDGERCFVEKVSYWFASPKQGDIVIVHFPGRGSTTFVKRVIATAGQTVEIVPDDSKGSAGGYSVLIDGERLDESAYSDGFMIDANRNYTLINYKGSSSCTVPEGCVFVMGDHRTDSHDSRSYDVGPIPLSDVLGRVRGVMYPFSSIRPVD